MDEEEPAGEVSEGSEMEVVENFENDVPLPDEPVDVEQFSGTGRELRRNNVFEYLDVPSQIDLLDESLESDADGNLGTAEESKMEDEDAIASGTTIEDIPEEILTEIFSLLTLYEVKDSVAKVCKRFARITENVSFFKQLSFGPRYSTMEVVQVLRTVPMLSRLEFCSRKDVNAILDMTKGYNTKLKVLKISSGKDQRSITLNCQTVLDYVKYCRGMKRLVLKRVSFDEPPLLFLQLGSVGPSLRSINLNHNMQLSGEGLSELVAGCGHLEDARFYSMSFDRLGSVSPYGDASVENLMHKSWATLKVLKLNALGLTDFSLALISRCPFIERLHLYRMVNVQDEGLSLVGSMDCLTQLVVTVPRAVTSAGWTLLLSSRSAPNLTRLTVSNSCTLDDTILKMMVTRCTNLERLEVPGCRQVSEIGVHSVIRHLHRLKHLNLFSTKSSVSRAFWLIPVHLPRLRLLVYRPTETRHASILPNLMARMPDLQLRESYRTADSKFLDVRRIPREVAQHIMHQLQRMIEYQWERQPGVGNRQPPPTFLPLIQYQLVARDRWDTAAWRAIEEEILCQVLRGFGRLHRPVRLNQPQGQTPQESSRPRRRHHHHHRRRSTE